MAGNEFQFRGALGGLVAADDQIRKERRENIQNQTAMIEALDKALTLDIASKYRERRTKAETEQAEASAIKERAQADVAPEAVQLGMRKERAEADLAEKRGAWYDTRQEAEIGQIESQTYRNVNAVRQEGIRISQAQQELALRANQYDQENAIAAQKVQLARAELQAKIESNASREEVDRANIEFQNAKLAAERAMASSERQLNVERARLLYWQAKQTEAEVVAAVSGSGSSMSTLTNTQINNKLGFENPVSLGTEIAEEVIDDLSQTADWKQAFTDINQNSPEGRIIKNNVITLVRRYRQMAVEGVVPAIPIDQFKRFTQTLVSDSFVRGWRRDFDAEAGLSDADVRDYWSEKEGELMRITRAQGGDPEKGYYLPALNAYVQEAKNNNRPIPPHLEFEYMLRNRGQF